MAKRRKLDSITLEIDTGEGSGANASNHRLNREVRAGMYPWLLNLLEEFEKSSPTQAPNENPKENPTPLLDQRDPYCPRNSI